MGLRLTLALHSRTIPKMALETTWSARNGNPCWLCAMQVLNPLYNYSNPCSWYFYQNLFSKQMPSER